MASVPDTHTYFQLHVSDYPTIGLTAAVAFICTCLFNLGEHLNGSDYVFEITFSLKLQNHSSVKCKQHFLVHLLFI